MAFRLIRSPLQEYIERDFYKTEFRSWQYAVFGVIGILCGILGPLYVNFRLNLLKVRV